MGSDDRTGFLANPLPIVMVVLAAAGVLLKTVPLQTARPTDPDRVTFVPTSPQDVDARLWQDPFAAVKKHETLSDRSHPSGRHTAAALRNQIQVRGSATSNRVTLLAASVFGGPFAEAAESRRRTRFAVVSALGFHSYHPENADALGYFVDDVNELTVPFEWFLKPNPLSYVLVLWLNEDKLTATPLARLQSLFASLTSTDRGKARPEIRLIGPAGSAMLLALVSEVATPASQESAKLSRDGIALRIFSPGATVSNCELFPLATAQDSRQPWDCFMKFSDLPDRANAFSLVRTIGTDDLLSVAILWELWQRGVNRAGSQNGECPDGLVLIGERDTAYGRTLLRYLNDGFSARCPASATPPVRTFSYLRGLDGMLPDSEKSPGEAPRKGDNAQSKDLPAQLRDTPPEHAVGRGQFDYLRRLADEVDRLDHDRGHFAKNGVKAIGIVGSDLYDKLLVLQALRARFRDKIFFTTDLDARYLHADQKDWARNLVVASNFGLALRPALQYSTLPFRDSYQTATYLAALMALENQPFDHWAGKMKEWLRPKIFEIGRTEAVHLASPSALDLTGWMTGTNPQGIALQAADAKCAGAWADCENIEPAWPSLGISFEHSLALLAILGLGFLSLLLASRRAQETVRAAYDVLRSRQHAEKRIVLSALLGGALLVMAVPAAIVIVKDLLNASLAQGAGEPFVWLDGVSVWPHLAVRFIGFVSTLALSLAFLIWLRLQAEHIARRFELPFPESWTLGRSWWSAVRTGPHLDLASFDKHGKPVSKSTPAAAEIVTLWQNYLRATRWREMAGWIVASTLIILALGFVSFWVLGRPSFPHRGQLVLRLHYILLIMNVPVLWLVIFWVGYEIRACSQFIRTLSGVRSEWPKELLDREEAATRVPREHLDDYIDFQLIVLATQRIHGLIYLPFVSILFMVLSRSDLFDSMDFPLALVFVTLLALGYALQGAVLLRRSAESARARGLEHYETRLLTQTRVKDSPPPPGAGAVVANPAPSPISVEQIKILMERIRNTREGAFAPIAQQPALRALLLPFGGYGTAQLLDYLINLKL